MTRVLVRSQRTEFTIHQSLLDNAGEPFNVADHIPIYFSALRSTWIREVNIIMENDDPDAFGLFVTWLYQGRMPTSDCTPSPAKALSPQVWTARPSPFSPKQPPRQRSVLREHKNMWINENDGRNGFGHINIDPAYAKLSPEELRLIDMVGSTDYYADQSPRRLALRNRMKENARQFRGERSRQRAGGRKCSMTDMVSRRTGLQRMKPAVLMSIISCSSTSSSSWPWPTSTTGSTPSEQRFRAITQARCACSVRMRWSNIWNSLPRHHSRGFGRCGQRGPVRSRQLASGPVERRREKMRGRISDQIQNTFWFVS